MPVSNEVENKQRTERRGKIRDVIKQAVSDTKGNKGLPAIRDTEKPNKPIELDDRKESIKGKNQHWGYHLLLDISDCNKKIDNEKDVIAFLKDMVKDLKMKALGEPVVVRVDTTEEGEQARGMSAFQIITTSHIAIHGDDDEWSAYIDVFSCKPFDPKMAINCIKRHFEPKHIGDFFLHRDSGSWPRK